jgi:hypothetical protein
VQSDDEPCIVGVGETDYCRAPGSGVTDLQIILLAAQRAAADAGIPTKDLDGIMTPYLNASAENYRAKWQEMEGRIVVPEAQKEIIAPFRRKMPVFQQACGCVRIGVHVAADQREAFEKCNGRSCLVFVDFDGCQPEEIGCGEVGPVERTLINKSEHGAPAPRRETSD